jgi:hypothetical protein
MPFLLFEQDTPCAVQDISSGAQEIESVTLQTHGFVIKLSHKPKTAKIDRSHRQKGRN